MNELIVSLSDFVKTDIIEVKTYKYKGDIGCNFDIFVSFKAVKISDNEIYVSGNIKGSVYLECSRCLCIYEHPLEIVVNANMYVINRQIDIGEEVRQLLVLEMPMKPICSKDCLGICRICGKHNKEIDSCSCDSGNDEFIKERWEKLLEYEQTLNKTNRRK
ncbi:MAG: YceD family protein [Endomicrobium sp.]|jgi:uncharacterized protein|nr:YceD family protein [Endomicrobium sp.]